MPPTPNIPRRWARAPTNIAPNFAPKLTPTWLHNGSQIAPGGHLGGQEICPGGLLPPGGLLERSWTPPGPKTTSLNRLLAGPRAPRRLVSAIFGSKWVPKTIPKGAQNAVRKRSELKRAKP